MINTEFITEFRAYLKSLNSGDSKENWMFLGETDDAFGTPGGSWKGEQGFKFTDLNNKNEFIIRTISSNKIIALESYASRSQVSNMNLAKGASFENDGSKSTLYESYVMTAGKGRANKDSAKKAFESLGINSNVIAEVDDGKPNWDVLINSLIKWTQNREKVKALIKEGRTKENPEIDSKNSVTEKDPIMNQEKQPLNQILYGPPGTGKTYFLLEDVLPRFQKNKSNKTDAIVEAEVISNLPWWKVFALILMHEDKLSVPQIKEHKYTKYKLETSKTNSLNQTVWGQLSSHTVEESKTVDYTSRQGALIFDKNNDSTWYLVSKNHPVIQELSELKQEILIAQQKTITAIENYQFVTFHQSTSYENFIEGIMPVLIEDSTEIDGDIRYEIKKGSFYQACEKAVKLAGFIGLKDCLENSKEERIERFKDAPIFCILIDEINRGNVSAVFGELITLIEEDKRLTKNEIIVELPYSRDKFGVPPNLYIVGTMNTADRSVEALDTALRRRFSFTEMPPRYDLDGLHYEYAGAQGSKILKKINRRIEKLLDRDHLIGHSYFLLNDEEKQSPESKLKDSFYRNIIPLLQEYFFGDYSNIGAVLGSGFVYTENDNDEVDFATGYENEDFAEKVIYQIIDYRPNQTGNRYKQRDMNFEKAIRLLMNQAVDEAVES